MRTSSRAKARLGRLAGAIRHGLFRLIYGKRWACARYERRHVPLAGPRPGARLG